MKAGQGYTAVNHADYASNRNNAMVAGVVVVVASTYYVLSVYLLPVFKRSDIPV